MLLRPFLICLIMVVLQDAYAGEEYTKIDSDGSELDDDAVYWYCIKNNKTGQIWERKSSANKDERYTLDEAFNYANVVSANGLCGYFDWRVPTAKELNSITDKSVYAPAIDVNYFPNTASEDYWSSTLYSASGSSAWFVNFFLVTSDLSPEGEAKRVRLVRGNHQYFDTFNFTKLDGSGNPLPDDRTDHSCVRDDNTGMVWEVKAADRKDATATLDEVNSRARDEANFGKLCGYSDWRIPWVEDLFYFVDYREHNPTVNPLYFPNTATATYWTYTPPSPLSTPYQRYGWLVDFSYGQWVHDSHEGLAHWRLVRGYPFDDAVEPDSVTVCVDKKGRMRIVEEASVCKEKEYDLRLLTK